MKGRGSTTPPHWFKKFKHLIHHVWSTRPAAATILGLAIFWTTTATRLPVILPAQRKWWWTVNLVVLAWALPTILGHLVGVILRRRTEMISPPTLKISAANYPTSFRTMA